MVGFWRPRPPLLFVSMGAITVMRVWYGCIIRRSTSSSSCNRVVNKLCSHEMQEKKSYSKKGSIEIFSGYGLAFLIGVGSACSAACKKGPFIRSHCLFTRVDESGQVIYLIDINNNSQLCAMPFGGCTTTANDRNLSIVNA